MGEKKYVRASRGSRFRKGAAIGSCCALDYVGSPKATGSDPVGAYPERNVPLVSHSQPLWRDLNRELLCSGRATVAENETPKSPKFTKAEAGGTGFLLRRVQDRTDPKWERWPKRFE